MKGKTVYRVTRTLDSGIHDISLPLVSAGMYTVLVQVNRKTYRGKIIVSHLYPNSAAMVSGGGISPRLLTKESAQEKRGQDTMVVTGEKYIEYVTTVENFDTSGVQIEMCKEAAVVIDIDGNEYQAVTIGNQIWTIENVRTTTYTDGDEIPVVDDNEQWASATTGACSAVAHSADGDSTELFGLFYNWHAVSTGKLAPQGWHVATDEEWDTLRSYLISNGYNWDGTTSDHPIYQTRPEFNKSGKSIASRLHWKESTIEGTIGNECRTNNRTGFNALPGGYRDTDGTYRLTGVYTVFWTSTIHDSLQALCRDISHERAGIYRGSAQMNFGAMVRLVKD
jgi:uncharacterized protein (TIGR02145 family)